MAIVKVHNKARNITYVYESVSYWDKELKQPRSHRKLIGRIDPVTGDIVPTRKRTKSNTAASSHSDTDYKALYEQALATIAQKDSIIAELRSQLTAAENDNRSCRRTMKKACDILMDTASGKERIHG
jgi:signal peptidase I